MKLDVGCGDRPTGDVNVDIKRKSAPNFIQASTFYLPFRNNAFLKVHCSHVIEHLITPLEALKEMSRVARIVEIYTPSVYDLDEGSTEHIYTWNQLSLKNFLRLVFPFVFVRYTMRLALIHGRVGKYLGVSNLILARMGIHRELYAKAWRC